VNDAKRMVGRRLGRRAELPDRHDRRRHVERGLSHGDEQLQGHRAFGRVIVECGALVGHRERAVARNVCVNFVGAVMVGVKFVEVRVHQRRAERCQRDSHRQPDRGQRPNHTVIVRETRRDSQAGRGLDSGL